MQAMVRPMAARLLLGYLRRPIPQVPASTSGNLRHRLAGSLHCSPGPRRRCSNQKKARDNALIRKSQVWRLATSAVLHGGIIHLAENSVFLADIGPMVEEVSGPKRFLTIYGASALTGSLMSYWLLPQRSLGSSGPLSGLVGAQAVYMWRHKEYLENAQETLMNIGACVLLNMGIGLYFRHRINNWAHLGGLLGGMAVE